MQRSLGTTHLIMILPIVGYRSRVLHHLKLLGTSWIQRAGGISSYLKLRNLVIMIFKVVTYTPFLVNRTY